MDSKDYTKTDEHGRNRHPTIRHSSPRHPCHPAVCLSSRGTRDLPDIGATDDEVVRPLRALSSPTSGRSLVPRDDTESHCRKAFAVHRTSVRTSAIVGAEAPCRDADFRRARRPHAQWFFLGATSPSHRPKRCPPARFKPWRARSTSSLNQRCALERPQQTPIGAVTAWNQTLVLDGSDLTCSDARSRASASSDSDVRSTSGWNCSIRAITLSVVASIT
jgi:hypothetical protein